MSEKILLVDDSQSVRHSIKDALARLFDEFIEAEDGLGAIKAFVSERPCFIITDVEMPSLDGYKFLSTIRNMPEGRDVPIILISGAKDTVKEKLKGFDMGASDYLIKPYDVDELVARVKSLLRMRRLMQELKEKNALLERLAVTDELTGLFNRRHFFDSVKQQMALSARHGLTVACMLIDIDHFKRINDTFGHQAGDMALKRIGSLLSAQKRGGELLARLGGEEFVLCLFNTDMKSARSAAERFRTLVGSHDFSTDVGEDPGRVTISVGVSIAPGGPGLDIDELLKHADKALYASKTGGRDRVTVVELDEDGGPRKP